MPQQETRARSPAWLGLTARTLRLLTMLSLLPESCLFEWLRPGRTVKHILNPVWQTRLK
jgi:hypothetical protein